jgi:hypothetical protein
MMGGDDNGNGIQRAEGVGMDGTAIGNAIQKNPADVVSLLAMADWWEERGELPAHRYALRWMAARRRFPGKYEPAEQQWTWVRIQVRYRNSTARFLAEYHDVTSLLPGTVFDLLPNGRKCGSHSVGYVTYAHAWDAINDLADALHKLRCDVKITPPKK